MAGLTRHFGEVRDWHEAPAVLDGLRNRQIRGKAVLAHATPAV